MVGEELVKIDIIAGFLGAGKTTLINKLLEGAVSPAETVLIENEFGEVSIDDELLAGSGMETKTLASGCICCTLRGSFVAAIPELVEKFHPKRIIVEPTGMASPADLLSICADAAHICPVRVNSLISVINAKNIEKLVKLHIPAFDMQFEKVSFAVMTHLEGMDPAEVERIRGVLAGAIGEDVAILAKPLDQVDGLELLSLAEEAFEASGLRGSVAGTFRRFVKDEEEHDHGHDHGHDHEHGHEGHHHHDSTAGVESLAFSPEGIFTEADFSSLAELLESEDAGLVLRAKGFLPREDGSMALFEQVYGSLSVGPTSYNRAPKFVVIGRGLDEELLARALKGPRM